MKKAINIWSFPGEMSLPVCMEHGAAAGFAGIELSLNEEGPLGLGSSAGEITALKKAAQETGIGLTSLASGLGWKYPLTANSIFARQQAADIIKKQIEFAVLLQVDTILVVPGVVGADQPMVTYGQAYDRAQEGLRALAAFAGEAGIVIGVENVWNKFLLSPLEMHRFLDEINSPFVQSYFDVGNVLISGYPQQWINILGSRIKKVHIKDYHMQDGFAALGKGNVDFPAVMEALEQTGYDDYLIAETPADHSRLQESLGEISRQMDRILQKRSEE